MVLWPGPSRRNLTALVKLRTIVALSWIVAIRSARKGQQREGGRARHGEHAPDDSRSAVTDADSPHELEIAAFAAIVHHAAAGHGRELMRDYAAAGGLILDRDGIGVAFISIVAYPITSPEGDGHGGT